MRDTAFMTCLKGDRGVNVLSMEISPVGSLYTEWYKTNMSDSEILELLETTENGEEIVAEFCKRRGCMVIDEILFYQSLKKAEGL